GPDFARYGGHTSCVAIGSGDQGPRLVLDAGTGIRDLTKHLSGPFRGTILLTHLHWDHTQGLPFFAAGDREDAEVEVMLPEQGEDAAKLLAKMMSPPSFPIAPWELRGRWSFATLEDGEHSIEGYSVLALEVPHKGGRTFGYRVSDGRSTIAYIPDHNPISIGPGPDGFGEYHPDALRLVKDADLVLHDSQYTSEEFAARAHFGHTTAEYAIGLAKHGEARRIVLFHHDPSRCDDELDRFADIYANPDIEIIVARDGMELEASTPN
ncbi:MAG TPA: MBL fold metallo-hydrolase, partial [Actinomycetota bacterium]|nr:MBL fold metallo-hydrolase [Actinomycetota bacterium]